MGENLCRLGDALGLDLEPVAREVMVGRFRADLVCRDRDSGARVVIEARLGHSDHAHLGQLLTYGVGLQGNIAVWLATAFHDEHRAVLDRLNEWDGSAMRCFAVELRTWSIGGSAAAPQFTVIAGPRDRSGPCAGAGGARLPGAVAALEDLEDTPLKVRRLNSGPLDAAIGEVRRHQQQSSGADRDRQAPGVRPATLAAIERALDMPPGALARPEGERRAIDHEAGDERRTEA